MVIHHRLCFSGLIHIQHVKEVSKIKVIGIHPPPFFTIDSLHPHRTLKYLILLILQIMSYLDRDTRINYILLGMILCEDMNLPASIPVKCEMLLNVLIP